LYEGYVCSRLPAEAITIAILTYVSAMKYSALLTSAMCEKTFRGSDALLDSAWGINTTVVLVNGQGNH